MDNKKEVYTVGLVIGILSIPCGLLIALSGWILGIVGIVINNNKKEENNTTAGFVLSIVGLALSIINSIIGAYLAAKGISIFK